MGQLDAQMAPWEEALPELSQGVDQMPASRSERERRLYERRHADLVAARRRVGEVVLRPPLLGALSGPLTEARILRTDPSPPRAL
ncbi:hypothetical protein WME91_25880 [Sorangium sp. So ce269]